MKDNTLQLIEAIAEVGKRNPSPPAINLVRPFNHFFLPDGSIDHTRLNELDGACTRRELLLRFLLLSAVLDQGPDIIGVRNLLVRVTNVLYLKEVRFLHKPGSFFEALGIAIDQIISEHETIKKIRADAWAAENQSRASRYNLFMDNTNQALNYAIFRWGVPLALPLILEKDKDEDSRSTALVDYLESWESAEVMSQQLKSHTRYGLGKAIGDKACHLFGKWMISSFHLSRRSEKAWGDFSYEVPYDSNAGRVLWRTGYLLNWATEEQYIRNKVIQPGQGKGGTNYIRVTNIRGIGAQKPLPSEIHNAYLEISLDHLKSHKKSPQKVEIQRIQHAYLLSNYQSTNLNVADFDNGLIYIGTKVCFNHENPLCERCPINQYCEGYQLDDKLIKNYRT